MSFSASQKPRASLIKAALFSILCTAMLAGCSMFGSKSDTEERDAKLAAILFSEEDEVIEETETAETGEAAEVVPPEDVIADEVPEQLVITPEETVVPTLFRSDAERAQDGILQYWEAITGGQMAGSAALNWIVGDRHVNFVRPVAVCVQGDLVYIVDMGLHSVFRYHRVTGEVERVLDILDVVSGDVADIFVTKDLAFYLTDTYGSRVLRFDHKGKLQQVYQNRLNLVRPVGVVEDEVTGSVMIADGEFDHVLIFNKIGDLYASLGRRGEEPGEFLNITAMAVTDQDVFVASRVGGKIQALSREGEYLYSLEQDVMRFPLSMEAGQGRVYTSEYMDNTIKIFERGRLVETFGGTGVTPGKFKRITDLWLDNDFLFAVDSLNGRIQVLKVASGSEFSAAPLSQ